MNCLIHNTRVYNAVTRSFYEGSVLVMNGKIAILSRGDHTDVPEGVEVYDAEGKMLIPGLVDVHTHGRVGGDFGTADDKMLAHMAESYADSGVTTVMPTLASAPVEELEAAIDRINNLRKKFASSKGGKARIAGVHLEGRYLNEKRRGAHALELLAALNADEMEALLSRVKGAVHISAALELEQNGEFLDRALEMGATVGLAHSDADYETATALIGRGVTSMTHLFNAMPPLHHRGGGAVAAGLLSESVLCELICDGYHVAPHMVKLVYRLVGDRLVLVTDSMEATGCADGEFCIAGNLVTVTDGKARTHDGAIAGSTLSLWDAVCNLCDFADAPFEDAVYAATMAPAKEIGLDSEIGSIEVGKRADLLLVDDNRKICRVMCGGYWHK